MDHKSVARMLIADGRRLVAEVCNKLLEPEFDVVGVSAIVEHSCKQRLT
jgi:hypothetical protein